MNSIEAATYNKPDEASATIVQTLRHQSIKDKLLVLVEGIDDVSFYSNYLNDSNTVINRIGGCDRVEYILDMLDNKYIGRYLIIKDADFDHLNNKKYPYHNLFLTDKHDYEMMALESSIVSNICFNHTGILDDKLFEKIMQDIMTLSYIKWYNNNYDSNINFGKKVNLGVCYDGKNPIELENCYSILFGAVCNKDINIECNTLDQFILDNPNPNLEQLTNGHDVIKYLIIALKKIKNKNLKTDDVKNSIINNYSINKFRETTLYNDISSWLNKYNYKDIFI